jgi:hypothetical protein
LNMPYHSGDKSTRYGYDDDGVALTPEQFITYAKDFVTTPAKFRKLNMSFGTKEGILEEGPPCLQHLCSKGFGEVRGTMPCST